MSSNGGLRKVRPLVWLLAIAAVATGGIGWATKQSWSLAALAALGVFLPVVDMVIGGRRAQADDTDLEKVADRLALAVRKQWADEAKRRDITSPPLDVSWRPASPSLVQPWLYLQRLAADGAGWPTPTATAVGPEDLAGTGPQILATYDRTPCGRLVVLGEPGAGKTVLLIRLVLDLLARRQDGEAVPILVPLASWNPDGQSLTDWLERQILRTYPALTGAISAGGKSRARALLDDGLILPVLDGLDEIRGGSRAHALEKINATLANHTGLVLSSRVKAFRHAVRQRPGVEPVRLDGAAGIRLDPLTPTVVLDYLTTSGGEAATARWAAARAAATTPGTPLAGALVTPLSAGLARTIYNPRGAESTLGLPNPTDLTTLPSAAAIERHLFAGFISASYRPHPDRSTRWNGRQADRYLRFLARHLEYRARTTSVAWWDLSFATSRTYLLLIPGIGAGLALGGALWLWANFLVGIVGGASAGLAVWLINPSPKRVAFRRLSSADVASGLSAGSASSGVAWFSVTNNLLAALTLVNFLFATLAGLAVGILITLVSAFATSMDAAFAADPRDALKKERTFVLLGAPASMTIGGLVFWPAGLMWHGPRFGREGGLTFGLVFGLVFVLMSAWARFGFTRFWLAARRQMPLHLITFLEDAHERGVLRQAGAVWEFRHANLQRHLAGPP